MRELTRQISAVGALMVFPILCGCGDSTSGPSSESGEYRSYMREFVIDISDYSKALSPGFTVVPQNGQELVTQNGEPDGGMEPAYVASIDGQGREDLFYGYIDDDLPTPAGETSWMLGFLEALEAEGVEVLVTDYCSTQEYVDSSYSWSEEYGFISFAADHRALDNVPEYPEEPWRPNDDPVSSLSDARNFLYLIDDQQFGSRDQFVDSISATRYDLLILDLFCCGERFTQEDLLRLARKPSGAERLVICYVSIGEAEDYRWYWQPGWLTDPPSWLGPENPDWPGNYLVRYWDPQWQAIIFGTDSSYVDMVIGSGFDGLYLDKIDSFEDYE